MLNKRSNPYSFFLGILVVLLMWLTFFYGKIANEKLYLFGILPRELSGLKGVVFAPFIHDLTNYKHIFNNSIPAFLLVYLLNERFPNLFLKVFGLSWLFSGFLVWLFAENTNAYHIGMSSIIYSLAAYLFTVGVLVKHLPYQAISLFIVFVYGSLIWGIFPTPQPISWEGHLAGMLTGIGLAFYFKRHIPQRPKFLYEIEKEMGIEPPDLEGMYNAQLEDWNKEKDTQDTPNIRINYDYVEKKDKEK